MKHYTTPAKVAYITRKSYSYYGNPHYYVTMETPDGETITGKTAINGSIGYGLTNYRDKYGLLRYHITRNGNTIFDAIIDL